MGPLVFKDLLDLVIVEDVVELGLELRVEGVGVVGVGDKEEELDAMVFHLSVFDAADGELVESLVAQPIDGAVGDAAVAELLSVSQQLLLYEEIPSDEHLN